MSDPKVRDLGTVTDADGYPLTVGVHYGAVIVKGISGPVARLVTEQADELAALLITALWQAARDAADLAALAAEVPGNA